MSKIQRGSTKRRHIILVVGCNALIVVCFIFDMNISRNLVSQVSSSVDIQEKAQHNSRISATRVPPPAKSESAPIICDRSHHEYDMCTVNGPVILHPTKPIFYVKSPIRPMFNVKLRPYPRKWESSTMSSIKEVALATSDEVQPCQVRHDSPALVFSVGGYTGNFFHDFNDGFIPLFITMNDLYNSSDDVILIVSDLKNGWMRKYGEILRTFSKHPIIDLDKHTVSHCFASVAIGLVSHGFMTIDPAQVPSAKNFTHFRTFLDKAYCSKGATKPLPSTKPRLVLATRSGSGGRVILNQVGLKNVAVEEGFEVMEFEPTSATPLQSSYDLLQSSHVLVGVHGAALTHMLFLRPGVTFLQIVPIGADWVSETCFGKPAKELGLDYLKYGILANESSLTQKYGAEHPLIRDPVGSRGGWKTDVMDVYLKEQNVVVDLARFRGYLKKMYSKASSFIENETIM